MADDKKNISDAGKGAPTMSDMRLSPDIAASGPANWPGLSICTVSSAT